jgi:hypothetical protein
MVRQKGRHGADSRQKDRQIGGYTAENKNGKTETQIGRLIDKEAGRQIHCRQKEYKQ